MQLGTLGKELVFLSITISQQQLNPTISIEIRYGDVDCRIRNSAELNRLVEPSATVI